MPRITHVLWTPPSTLCIWTEDTDRAASRPRGRTPATKAPLHPFAVTPQSPHTEIELTLPTSDGVPVASEDDTARPLTLEPWRVRAVRHTGPDAIEALLSLADGGDDVRTLVRAADLGLELAARGRIVPTVSDRHARWAPVPTTSDAARLGTIAAAMPSAVRAHAPDTSSVDIVADVVAAAADYAARTATRPRRRHPLVRALFSVDGSLDADADKLERTLDEWRRAAEPTGGPLRTCFRLVPPSETDAEVKGKKPDENRWRVEFLLQATDDPSLLVDAADVWGDRGTARTLAAAYEHPHERLLADLGRAARVFGDLHAALDEPRPTGVGLDADGAHRFVTGVAPLLEEAGYGVIVPSWRSRRLRVRTRVTPRDDEPKESSGLLGMAGLVDYRHDVALGDDTLTDDELRALAGLKAPLVRVRGEWVLLDPHDVDRAIRVLDRPSGTVDADEALRLGLGLANEIDGLPVDVETHGWLGTLLDGADDQRWEPVPTPAALDGTLRPYQERGVGWLSYLAKVGLGGILADDMGLGKTVQVLALLCHEREAGPRDPTLLICPMSLVGNWQREAERFAPDLRVHVRHGPSRRKKIPSDTDLVITTYALAVRDRDLLADHRWGRVVCDEAQHIKNPSSKSARAVRSIPAPHRVALTGTPVENRLSDLWSIMEFANPGLLGSREAFRRTFTIPIERHRDPDATDLLRRVTAPFVLRRTKTDPSIVGDLPDKQEMTVFCTLTREQATLYQAVVDDMLARIEEAEEGSDIARRGLVLATLTKLKQICNHPAQFLGDGSPLPVRSGKLERTLDMVETAVDGGDHVLVFTQYAQMGRLLQDAMRTRIGGRVPLLHGGVRKTTRDEMVAAFQDPDGPPVMVLSIKAGGVGLNLTRANQVVHFDRWWNPAVEDQATDRAFRIGQRRDVQVRKLVCAGTVEERIDALIASKRELAAAVVGSGEAWLTELSTAELRELVRLGRDVVGEE